MFVMVAIMASFFQSGVNKGGGLVISGAARQGEGQDEEENGQGFYGGSWQVCWEMEYKYQLNWVFCLHKWNA